jgi:hypothetical protein
LREGGATSVDLSNPARPAESFWPRIVRVAPFGCDTMPDRFKSAWKAFTARCPTGVRPILWQAAVTDAADLFGHWGLQLVAQGFMPGFSMFPITASKAACAGSRTARQSWR